MENLDVEGGTSQNTSEILNGEFTIRLTGVSVQPHTKAFAIVQRYLLPGEI